MGPIESPNRSTEQKFVVAPEKHNDDTLKGHVEDIQKLIKEGANEYVLRQAMKKIWIETKSIETIILGIDQLRRAKNGRVFTWKDGDAERGTELGLIRNGSNLAKLIQLYIVAHHSSVQFKDFQSLFKSIDGNLERFSMQGLSQLIHHIQAETRLEDLKRSMRDEAIAKSLKAMGVDVETTIRNTEAVSDELRKIREMTIDIKNGSMIVTSYGQSSQLSLSDGKVYFGTSLGPREYPMNIHLVRDRDTKNSPLVGESDINRKNIHSAISLMNLVHFTVKQFMNETVRRDLGEVESPFYIGINGDLNINNEIINDTTIAKTATLQKVLADARSGQSIPGEMLARFLNDLFRSFYPASKLDRSSTYVGGKKPISSVP